METLQRILDEAKTKGHFSIDQVYSFTIKCFAGKKTFEDFEEDETSEPPAREDAFKLAKEVLKSSSSGSAEHYHNYAVTFAKHGEFDFACDVLLCGLKRYSTNIDLLSDFLEYAIKSSNDEHYQQCEELCRILETRRPVFWNWRAYDFTIDYLLDKIDRGIGEPLEIKTYCLELAREFQKRIPTNEFAYVAEANIYSTFGENGKEMNALKKAMSKSQLHVVRVAITLAEIYIKRNQPQEALKCLQRVISDFADTTLRTTPSQVYVLSVICKTAQLLSGMNASTDSEQAVDKGLAQDIVSDWRRAKKFNMDEDHQMFKTAKILINLVETISGIRFDDDDDEL